MDPITIGLLGLGGIDLILGSKKQGEANDLQRQAIEMALLDRTERSPLREQFVPNALTPIASAPNLSYLRDAGNPFSASFTLPKGGTVSPHVPSQLRLTPKPLGAPAPAPIGAGLPPMIQKKIQQAYDNERAARERANDPAYRQQLTAKTSGLPPYLQQQIQRTLARPKPLLPERNV